MPADPLEPTAPSPVEAQIQAQIRESARSPLVQWFRSQAWKIFVPLAVVILAAGWIVGPAHGFDYLAGVRAPSEEIAIGYRYASAVALTAVGWLAVPALVGGIVGYIVTTQLGAYRSKTQADIFGGHRS